MAIAAGGNRDSRLNGAKVVGLNGTINGKFLPTNLDELVRFNISQRSSFNLDLSGIAKKNNIDVELYQLTRPLNNVLKSIGKIDFRQLKARQRNANLQLIGASRNGGNQNEEITADIDAGDYVVRFLKRSGNRTGYTATLVATPIQPTLPGGSTGGGNSGGTGGTDGTGGTGGGPTGPAPIPVIALPANNAITDQLGSNAEKRYTFTAQQGDYQINLAGLSADADLQILTADGNTVLNTSANTGTADDRVVQPLDAGQYILRVFRKASNTTATNFTLSVAKLQDTVPNTQAEASDLPGLTNAPANQSGAADRINYVVANAKDSPIDYYKFTLKSSGFVQVGLTGTGRPSDGNVLFGDLDVDVYGSDQNPDGTIELNRGISGRNTGSAAESFGGTLSAGDYYVRVHPKTGVNTGSPYRLKITYSPSNGQPSIIRDALVGDASSNPQNFTEVGGLSYFTTDSKDAQGNDTTGLWLSNGTLNRTAKLLDFKRGSLSKLTQVGGKLYFVANTDASGSELWTSDGTTAGTKQVADLVPGAGGSNPSGLTAVGNDLYFFTSYNPGGNTQVVKKLYYLQDGTTTPVDITGANNFDSTDPGFANLTGLPGATPADNALYFSASDATGKTELWQAKGTTLTEMPLQNPNSSIGSGSSPTDFTVVGNKLFVAASTNPTSVARKLVRVDNFQGGYNPTNFTTFSLNNSNYSPGNLLYQSGSDTLYFAATGDSSGRELYKLSTPDTALATDPSRVTDINTAGDSNPSSLVNAGSGRIIFQATDGSSTDLWITDGTGTNTRKLSSVTGLSGLANLTGIGQLTLVNNSLFFVGTSSAAGTELHKVVLNSDGNSGLLTDYDIYSGSNSSNPNFLTAIGGQLFFVANNGTNGNEPWSIAG